MSMSVPVLLRPIHRAPTDTWSDNVCGSRFHRSNMINLRLDCEIWCTVTWCLLALVGVFYGDFWGIICLTCSSICIFKDHSTILDERRMVRSKSLAEMDLHVFKSSTWSLVKSFSDVWPEIKTLFIIEDPSGSESPVCWSPSWVTHHSWMEGLMMVLFCFPELKRAAEIKTMPLDDCLKTVVVWQKSSLCQPYVQIWGKKGSERWLGYVGWASTLVQERTVKESC